MFVFVVAGICGNLASAIVSFKLALLLLRFLLFLHFFELLKLLIWALSVVGVPILIISIFIVSQELLAGFSVLEILVFENIFLQL